MLRQIDHTLTQENVLFHYNQGITVCKVHSQQAGNLLAKTLLYSVIDRKTVLYLSGGNTPRDLYIALASEEKLKPGAVGLVDERFGKKFHQHSNETMIKGTGLLRYLDILDIPFYPILIDGFSRPSASERYDRDFRRLNSFFAKHVGILGMGSDGHISSIIPNRPDFKNPLFDKSQKNLLISDFEDKNSTYGERIGMTFLGLSMLDLLLVLVFGEGKQNALVDMFNDGPEELLPARFFKRSGISAKTLFITDQTI